MLRLPLCACVCVFFACAPTPTGDAAEGEAASEGEGDAAEGEGDAAEGEGEGEGEYFDAGPIDPNPAFDDLALGVARDLGSTALTPPAGEESADAVTDYSALTYDANNHLLLMFGGGHATTQTSALYAFSFTSLSWSPLYDLVPTAQMNCANFNQPHGSWVAAGFLEQPLSRHTYDSLEVPFVGDGSPSEGSAREFWMFRTGDAVNNDAAAAMVGDCLDDIYWGNDNLASVFDFDSGSWSFTPTLFGGGFGDDAVEYDPIAHEIVALGNTGLTIVNLATREQTRLVDAGFEPGWPSLGYANHLTYASVDDAFYYFNRNDSTVFRLTRNRVDANDYTLEPVTYSGTYPTHGEPGFDDDPRHGVIGGAVANGTITLFDPLTSTFTQSPATGGADEAFHAIAFDPVNNVFVYVGTDRHTWAVRTAD